MNTLLIILIIILTIYTPLELTNLIVKYVADQGYHVKFFGEVCFIWLTYISAIILIAKWKWRRHGL